jgi:hypothetical protein
MEKALLNVVDEPLIQTKGKIINKTCIVDGTSATAIHAIKEIAIKNGANAESGTSLNADKLLKAVSVTNENPSLTKPTTSGDGKPQEVGAEPFPTEPNTASMADQDAPSKPLDNDQTLDELAADLTRENREKAGDDYYILIAGKSASEADALSELNLSLGELRCASAPVSAPALKDGEAPSQPNDEHPVKMNPLRPESNGEVFEDCPPTSENYPDNSAYGHPDNAPRKAPTGPVDGPEEGRLGAVPNPAPILNVLRQMYPDAVHQQIPPEKFVDHAETRTHVPAFYQDPAKSQQPSLPQRHASNVPGMDGPLGPNNRPRFSADFPMPQNIPHGGLPADGTGVWPSEAPRAPLPPAPTRQYHSPPRSRRISDLRSRDSSSSWQQTSYDSIHEPAWRRSPPRNQSYSSNRQSSYVNNGNSRGRGGRRYSTERHYNNDSGNSYSKSPHELGYSRNSSGYGPQSDRRFSSSGGGPPFVGHRVNSAGYHHANASIRNQSHDNRDRRDTASASSHRSLQINPDCKNYEQWMSPANPAYKVYVPCGCEYCKVKNRTIFISGLRNGELESDDFIKSLKMIFARFGSIQNHRVVALGKSIEFE